MHRKGMLLSYDGFEYMRYPAVKNTRLINPSTAFNVMYTLLLLLL